jgi:hypothetical protein
MAGLEDLMNIRTQGGTDNAPMMQDPNAGMGAPPPEMMGGMGAPPPPEMMGGMGMDPNAGMGMAPEMMAPEPQEMQGGESAMLAEAVIERTQGDINAAIAVLDDAKAMLMASADQGNQEPMMANMGGPLYRGQGGSVSESDVLKQMIMSDLKRMESGGALKAIPEDNAGLRKLPEKVRNKMGFMADGGEITFDDLTRYVSS